jgi:hypothetical protein
MTPRSGLRRFVGAEPRPAAAPKPAEPEPVVEKCELCGTPAGPEHGHVVDLEHRSIMCACRPCFLLFTRPEAGGGRFRAIPERYLTDPGNPLSQAEWDALGVPVSSAFFLRGDSTTAAFYPSPAGATECLLDLAAWAGLVAEHPLLGAAEPEVEAILVRGTEHGVETYLVPIDACYQLVGTVRMYWKGFDGGQEARERIDEFFAGVRARAQLFSRE